MSIITSERSPYRSVDDVLRHRRDERLREVELELAPIPAAVTRAFTRRVGRAAGGATAVAGAVVLSVVAIVRVSARVEVDVRSEWLSLTAILAFAGVASLVASLGARVLASRYLARRVARERFVASDDVRADLLRLDRWSVGARAAAYVHRWEVASVALPLAGTALLAPLTLHMPVGWLLSNGSEPFSVGFDKWILLSMAIVGHAHVILALLGWHYALRLRRYRTGEGEPPRGAWRAWLAALAAGAVPGALFLLVPTALVALTGALFIPASYIAIERRVLGERLALAEAGAAA